MIQIICTAELMGFVQAMGRQLVSNRLLAAMEHVDFWKDAAEWWIDVLCGHGCISEPSQIRANQEVSLNHYPSPSCFGISGFSVSILMVALARVCYSSVSCIPTSSLLYRHWWLHPDNCYEPLSCGSRLTHCFGSASSLCKEASNVAWPNSLCPNNGWVNGFPSRKMFPVLMEEPLAPFSGTDPRLRVTRNCLRGSAAGIWMTWLLMMWCSWLSKMWAPFQQWVGQ